MNDTLSRNGQDTPPADAPLLTQGEVLADPDLIYAKEAAEILGVHRSTANAMAYDGRLTAGPPASWRGGKTLTVRVDDKLLAQIEEAEARAAVETGEPDVPAEDRPPRLTHAEAAERMGQRRHIVVSMIEAGKLNVAPDTERNGRQCKAVYDDDAFQRACEAASITERLLALRTPAPEPEALPFRPTRAEMVREIEELNDAREAALARARELASQADDLIADAKADRERAEALARYLDTA